MRKLKVGDKVRIRKDLEVGKRYNGYLFNEAMACMRGKIVTIAEFCGNRAFIIKEFNYYWTPKMVEATPHDKLIFRENATILLKDGKKHIAKCHPVDTYDREKGLLLCLAKAYGYSYQDIQDMLSNARYKAIQRNTRLLLASFGRIKARKIWLFIARPKKKRTS